MATTDNPEGLAEALLQAELEKIQGELETLRCGKVQETAKYADRMAYLNDRITVLDAYVKGIEIGLERLTAPQEVPDEL